MNGGIGKRNSINMTNEQKEEFIRIPFKSILERLGLDLSRLGENVIKEGVTFYLKEMRRPALFSIDKVKIPQKIDLPTKANTIGGFFFNGMDSTKELDDLVSTLPSKVSSNLEIKFYGSGNGRGLPYLRCSLELMEQLFDQPTVIEYFQQRYNHPFRIKMKDKIIELIENLGMEMNTGEEFLNREQLSQLENHEADTIEGLKSLEEKIKFSTPEAQKIIALKIERGTIAHKVKALTNYKCLVCEQLGAYPYGFKKKNSEEPYIESHHVTPVSLLQQGSLSATNIITLCANHHRLMHYGNAQLLEEDETSFVFQIESKKIEIKKIKIR